MSENLVDSIAPATPSLKDAAGLADALRARLRGEVRFDNGARASMLDGRHIKAL